MANNNQGRCAYSARFCLTDLELIAYCLRPKIGRGAGNPNFRFCYEVYIYDHSPDDLAEKHDSCENKWYFLTSKVRKYTNENLGYWKATAKDIMVFDDVTQRVLGRKRCLAYFDQNKLKSPWLMHEYTMIDPNIVTIGNTYKDNNKIADWVLCKIYKKEKNQNFNNNLRNQVQNKGIKRRGNGRR